MKVSVIVPNHGRDITPIKNVVECMPEVEFLEVDLGFERSYQRNIGIAQAKGDYIFILDSDQLPTGELIRECIDIMDDYPECGGIYIPETIVGSDWFSKLRNYERNFYTSTCIDVIRFVRREGCPFFDETLCGPEDADWELRIDGKRDTSKNHLFHFDRISLMNYLKKKAYYTKSMDKFLEKHPNAKVLQFWYRCFGVFFENGKWLRLFRHPIMAIKLYILVFIRGIIYVKR